MEDVIIVGAGPAGSMAARTIARQGYSVLVLEKKKEVGFPVQCAEALSQYAIESNGLEIDESWVKQRLNGIKIFVPNGKHFLSLKDVLSIDRQKFDKFLMDKAIGFGTMLMLGTPVTGIKKKRDKWEVKTKEEIFSSKILIGADGFSSNVAEWLGIIRKKENLTTLNYKFSKEDIDFPDDSLCIFNDPVYTGGYVWVFPRGDEINIGIGTLESFGKNKELLDNFCETRGFDTERKKSHITGHVPVNYELETFSKDSTMVAGDAAGLTNPIFGGGIHTALISGKMSGDSACKALESGDSSALDIYNTLLRESPFCDPVLRRGRDIIYSMNEKEWNFVGDVFEYQDWKRVPYTRIIKKFIKTPTNLVRINRFLTLKKAIDISMDYGV